MDEKKILLVNLSKGRLGEKNANLIGLILVGKLQMAALSRVDSFGKDMPPFYAYIDEFQNVTTDSIASILSEARKYKLSLNITHQYLAQLQDSIKNAVFGNVGSLASFRVGSEDAQFLESRFAPTFSSDDIMKIDNWNLIYNNAKEALAYQKLTQANCSIESYHLILDPNNTDWEIQQYRNNFIEPTGLRSYIWKMHNWSGNYNPAYERNGTKRTCGRPLSAEITVRAGGINGNSAAVTPCCQVLGPPTESKSVLGHFSNQTFEEIWEGEKYNFLRKNHIDGTFDNIEYCKDCDFLIGDLEVLVWSNDPTAIAGRPLGTKLGFNT
jgi:hypothetical protein